MSATMPSLHRRALAASLVIAPAAWLGVSAQTQRRLATPRQTEGPFYPPSLPADSDSDLLTNGTLQYQQGTPVWLSGQVTDLDGRPVRGAQVEIWQCDEDGHYHHPADDGDRAARAFQGFGRVVVDQDGGYRFHTIEPVPYSGRTPHIHMKVKLGGRELLTTQIYKAGHAGNARDALWRSLGEREREALTIPFRGGEARFPVVLQV